MKKCKGNRYAALSLSLLLVIYTILNSGSPWMLSYAYTQRRATVNATNLNVRSGPGTTYSIVAKLSHGTSVMVIGEKNASDGALWYEIRFSGVNGVEMTGYASNSYIKFPVTYTSDANFEAYLNSQGFPESYKPGLRELHAQYPQWVFTAQKTNLDWNTVIQNESIVGRNLVHKDSVSSWKSTADGAYNWDSSSWPGFDGNAWVAASEDIIRYYMDPRNFLDEMYIFQFLLQSYDGTAQTRQGLESMVKGTFLEGSASGGQGNPSGGSSNSGNEPSVSPVGPGGADQPGGKDNSAANPTDYGPGVTNSNTPNNQPSGSDGNVSLESPHASISKKYVDVVTSNYGPGMDNPSNNGGSGENAPSSGSNSYIDIIMNAGAQAGVNPYVLAAMIIQEQGAKGTSGSISGTASGYEGYYNFFNIEAYQSGSLSAVQRGLWYASQSGNYGRPWNSVEKSILGGSIYYGTNYVKVGQDTFYLKKFNVQGDNLYKHQYMTNVQGAAGEAAKLSQAYTQDMKKTALEFKIPVYNNMPESIYSKPNGDGSPNNKLSQLNVNGYSLTPTFHRDTTEYDLIVDPSISSITVGASAIDTKASVSGTGNIALQSGNNEVRISVKAQNGTIRDYIIHVVRQGDSQNGGSAPGNQGPSPGNNTPGGSSGGPGSGDGNHIYGPGGGPGVTDPGGSNVTVTPPASPGENPSPGGDASPGPSPGGALRGDNNGDGAITILDVLRLQRHILGLEALTQEYQTAADVNQDGKLTVQDIMILQRHLLGIEKIS